MIDLLPEDFGRTDTLPVSINTDHGTLHGELGILPDAPGIVVLAHDTRKLDARDLMLARFFHHAGLSTLSADLIAQHTLPVDVPVGVVTVVLGGIYLLTLLIQEARRRT